MQSRGLILLNYRYRLIFLQVMLYCYGKPLYEEIMKKIILILMIIASAFALTACNNNVSTDKLLYRNWPKTGKETFTYDVTYNGQGAGTLTQSVENVDGGYLVTVTQTMLNGDTTTGTVKFANTGAFAFPPVESTKTSTIDGKTITQHIVYGGNSISYYEADGAVIPEGEESKSYSLSAPYYDNMQFYTVIRGAKFNNKFSLSFNLFIPNEKTSVKISCSLSSTESLTYRVAGTDGTVTCQSVALYRSGSIAGEPIKTYYATSDITVGGKAVKQALVKFIEGQYVYSLTNIEVA